MGEGMDECVDGWMDGEYVCMDGCVDRKSHLVSDSKGELITE